MTFERIKDTALLTPLWKSCFGDSEAAIEAFWRKTEGTVVAFAALDSKLPAAMLCALPTTLIDESGEALRAAYLYAVCTAPAYRRQGVCAALLSYAEQALRNDFDVCMLVPDGEALFRYYEKRGYHTVFYHSSKTLAAQKADVKIAKLTADAYRNLRELQLYGSFVSYDTALLGLQEAASAASGAGLYRLETSDAVCCAAAEKQGETLLLKELLPCCPAAAAALAAQLGCKSVVVRTQGKAIPFGMVKPLRDVELPEESYLGLAFD